MSVVLVTADFPGVQTQEREDIYNRLAKMNWTKVTEFGRDISTVWVGNRPGYSKEAAVNDSIKEFVQCSAGYTKPKLVLHWGPESPYQYGLT